MEEQQPQQEQQQQDWIESYKKSKNGVVMDYYNKKIMAPMVRVGTYPMRILAYNYGCDIAYSEELIDLKLMKSTRVVNEKLKTIDFIAKDQTLCYRTSEKDVRNVLQLGTASSMTALEAAKVVCNDICALDINMGCPKFFSVQGGMGSALLSKPETIKDILTTLKRNLNGIPITCKIRLLSTDQETIDLLRIIESTGVSAIGVHCRMIPERPRDPAHWDRLENILSNASFSVPIIANGDIFEHADIEKIKKQTKVDSIMIARGVVKNVSIFSKPSPIDLKQIIQEYTEIAYQTNNSPVNTKYVINSMLNENNITTNKEAKAMSSARDYDTITKIWGINDKFKQFCLENNIEKEDDKNINKNKNNNNKNSKKTKLEETNNQCDIKKQKIEDEDKNNNNIINKEE
ncbi:tRNA-dihydrouridine synthase 2-like protein [Dictyostelium discoideum AX4]|uniref:tRNA-dihydrouridine synthase 2-like protein n=1 Tax=Dictyostelium discoideum TaxID=44689 RepID=Q54QJ2_DICDI|nr:tRNA-dihydrouridine synthase 2-like protein [Dictyostelium discoideum AX4]EAL65553.1 tRNA-dihydrouridine synthase 2-like protein [Dictyostelium discoideum AX4]|eukprot:XP_638879.1 tRNA-dihydrouridine synthase 2-like protein [Dictyostelium discoideum AX4]